MSGIRLYVADAFTAVPFRGNPASVCVLDRDISDATMQAIASEMNHSETAFVRPLDGPPHQSTRFGLRWFTPKVEVPLCGHATLATAAVIFREIRNPADEVVFETLSGPLSARREHSGIALDFPAADFAPASASQAILDALGALRPVAAFHARGGRNLLLHLANEGEVRTLNPDFERLQQARGHEGFVGVIATAAGPAGYDFVSRYFAPWIGVNEDPVTGAAHCALAPYWAALTGKHEMRAQQASARGGDLTVRVRGDRVVLVGDAVVVMTGNLRIAVS
jgi:PhzF family phenazine biosynthesis protein